jgi:hypothetical protein
MVRWSVTGSGIGIGSAPGQDGSTLDDQIAGPDQTAPHSSPNGEDKQAFKEKRACRLPAFAQSRRTRDAWPSRCIKWQTTGTSKSGPTPQPIMHILVGKSEDAF